MRIMTVTHEFTVDLKQEKVQIVKVPQYNKDTHILAITISDDGSPLYLSSTDYKAYLKVAGAAGNFYNLSMTISGGVVTITLPESLTAIPGRHNSQVDIVQTSTEARLCSMPFCIYILESVYSDEEVIASNEYQSLTDLLTTAQDLINRLNMARTYYVIAAENSTKQYRIVCDEDGNLSTSVYTPNA